MQSRELATPETRSRGRMNKCSRNAERSFPGRHRTSEARWQCERNFLLRVGAGALPQPFLRYKKLGLSDLNSARARAEVFFGRLARSPQNDQKSFHFVAQVMMTVIASRTKVSL